jgi:glycosyltransferase involved in cell wall biosynthesis
MKILQIIPSLNKGGAERLVLDICTTLDASSEHEVRLVTFRTNNDYAFASEGLDIDCIPNTVVPSLTGQWTIDVAELQAFINDFKPDVIHSHLFEAEMVLSQVDCGSALRVMHFHDNMPQLAKFSWRTCISKQRFTNWYERSILQKKWNNLEHKCAIAIAEDSFVYAKKVLGKKTSIHKLLNGISVKRFTSAQPKGKTLQLCMIGSLVPKKNQKLAIQTLKCLHEKGYPFELHFLGDGSLRSKLESYRDELDLTNFVHFHGNVDDPETYLHTSFVYLHTASYEPLGLVLLEAMASGTPVVCTNGRGNKDLITHGTNGFIFDEQDPELLAEQIIALWEDEKLYEEIQQEALRFVQAFDMADYCRKLLEIYEGNM